MNELIASLAKTAGVPEIVVMEAARGCADRLANWCEGNDAAIAELMADPCAMIEIAMADWMKTQQKIATECMTNPDPLCQVVYDMLTA